MTDWTMLAAGQGLELSEEELTRMSAVLAALEEAFQPLVGTIPLETEPALTFACPREEPS